MADRPLSASVYSNMLVYVRQTYVLLRNHRLILQSHWEHVPALLVLDLIFMVDGVKSFVTQLLQQDGGALLCDSVMA